MTSKAILANFKFEMALQKDKSQQITQKTSYKHITPKINCPSLRVLVLVSKRKRYILGILLEIIYFFSSTLYHHVLVLVSANVFCKSTPSRKYSQ